MHQIKRDSIRKTSGWRWVGGVLIPCPFIDELHHQSRNCRIAPSSKEQQHPQSLCLGSDKAPFWLFPLVYGPVVS